MTAARMAEVVAGKPFDAVMIDVLFSSLGSTKSTFDFEVKIDRIPTPYERTKNGPNERRVEPIGMVNYSGGSLVAT